MAQNKKSGYSSKAAKQLSEIETSPQLPSFLEAEQSLIGLILYKNLIYDNVSDIIRADHFFAPIHEKIWTEIQERIDVGETASIVGISKKLENDADFIDAGGGQYLADLLDGMLIESNARNYAEMIVESYKQRRFFMLASEIRSIAPTEKSENIAAKIDGFMSDILSEEKGDVFTLGQSSRIALEQMERLKSGQEKPILTGIERLDQKITGFYGGKLYVLAGRPAMGKTACALSMAKNQSQPYEHGGLVPKAPIPVLFFSLEMPKEELARRILARETEISIERQQSHYELAPHEWDNLVRAQHGLKNHKLFIIDKNCNTLQAIKAHSRRFVRANGKGVIYIDYLGLIEGDKRITNQVQQIELITTGLKRLAKEIDCPIVLLAQLSRDLESRDDKRPMLADLRGSGSIEQDADMVIFCFREEYYLNNMTMQKWPREKQEAFEQRKIEHEYALSQAKGKADLIIGKYRNGTTGSVRVEFSGLRQEFS